VLHEGAVPHEAKEEGADENVEYEDEKLCEHVRLVASLRNFLDHLLGVNIFFSLDYK